MCIERLAVSVEVLLGGIHEKENDKRIIQYIYNRHFCASNRVVFFFTNKVSSLLICLLKSTRIYLLINKQFIC